MAKEIFSSILFIFFLLRRGLGMERENVIYYLERYSSNEFDITELKDSDILSRFNEHFKRERFTITYEELVEISRPEEYDIIEAREVFTEDIYDENDDYKDSDSIWFEDEHKVKNKKPHHSDTYTVRNDFDIFKNLAEIALILNGIQNTTEALKLLKYINRINSTATNYNEQLLPLLSAENNTLMVELILQNVVDVYFADNKGNSALHYAAMNDNSVLAFDICEKDASGINNQNDFRETAFIIATSRNNTKICRMLLDRDADPYIPNADGFTSLHEAVMNKNREIVQFILSKSIRGIDEVDYKGDTALSLAVIENDHILAEIIVKAGADPYIQNFEGQTSLHLAVKVKSELIVSVLLKENRSGINIKNRNGMTAFLWAAFSGILSIIKILLINGADPNIVDNHGVSPLHAASTIGNVEILKCMFNESHPDPNLQDEEGNTALHYAVNMQHIQMVSVFLEMGADPKVVNNNNRTALHTAAILGDQDISVVLLNASKSILEIPDRRGHTALHLAVFFRQTAIIETLLEFGANPNALDSICFNPLRLAVQVIGNKRNTSDVHEHFEWIKVIKILLRFGSDPYILDQIGNTALHAAAEIGSVDTASMILEHSKSGINIQNFESMTALNVAIFNKSINIAVVLLENFADPYIQDHYGRTSLHIAVGHGEIKFMYEILASNNTGVNKGDMSGKTALYYAILFPSMQYPEIEIASYIENDGEFVPFGALVDSSYYGSKNEPTLSVVELRELGYSVVPVYNLKKFDEEINKIIDIVSSTYKFNKVHFDSSESSHLGLPTFTRKLEEEICFESFHVSGLKHNESAKRVEMVNLLLSNHADYRITDEKGYSVFHKAVQVDDIQVLRSFLRKMKLAEINEINNKGETPLHIAIRTLAVNSSKYLLENGVNPYVSDDNGRTALHAAAEMHNVEIMQLILNISKYGINLKDNSGLTALSLSTTHANKVKELCKVLLENGADPYVADNRGNTALHAAIIETVQKTLYRGYSDVPVFTDIMKMGYEEIHDRQLCLNRSDSYSCQRTICHLYLPDLKTYSVVEMILRYNSSGINLRNDQGYTAFFLAAFYSSTDLQFLLDVGGDPYIVDNEGHSSLHALIAGFRYRPNTKQNIGLLRKIMATNNSGINMQDVHGYTALHFAASISSKIVYELIKNGADPDIAENRHGWTPLHIAVALDDRDSVEVIMGNPKTDVNVQNVDGQTPLHLALKEDIVKLMINKGANIAQRDLRGRTLFHYLVLYDKENVISKILSDNSTYIDDPTLFGETPLSIAVSSDNPYLVKYLLKKGADSKSTQNYMKKPLEIAITEDNYSAFQALWKSVDNILTYNMFGSNVLHSASVLGESYYVVKIVEKFHAYLDFPDRYGRTALHYAAMGSEEEVMQYLLEQGANPFITDNFGQNVLHYAAEGCSASIIEFICVIAENIENKNELNQLINKRNLLDITPLKISSFKGNFEAFEFLWKRASRRNDSSYCCYESILFSAALGGNLNIIKLILNNTNIPGIEKRANGLTPAMGAAARGRREAFDVLISKGARIDDVSYYGQTMLHFAAQGGDKEIIETVLNNSESYINSRDVEGFTPLMNAVYHDKLDAVEFLLNNNADPHIKNIYGEDAIKIAAKVGNAVLKSKLFNVTDNIDNVMGILLARKNASFDRQILFDLVAKSSLRKHPIFLAAAKRDITSIETLLSSSVKIRKRSFPNLMKELMNDFDTVINDMKENEENAPSKLERLSPLDIALLFHQNLPVVKKIIQILNLDEKSINYKAKTWTPLDYALMTNSNFLNDNNANTLLYLLNRYKNGLNESTNVFGWTAAHKAAWFGNSQAIGFLHYYGVDLNKADNFGRTPLHYAALNGYSQAVNKILHLDKMSINKKDKRGFTPLLLAQIYNNRKSFKHTSDINSDSTYKESVSIYDISDLISKISISNRQDFFLTTSSLIAHKADLDVRDRASGWTALHWAAMDGDYQSVPLLVSGGAKVNRLSWTGETPLLIARKWMRRKIYKYLKSNNGVW